MEKSYLKSATKPFLARSIGPQKSVILPVFIQIQILILPANVLNFFSLVNSLSRF